jgi:hypothetical protein
MIDAHDRIVAIVCLEQPAQVDRLAAEVQRLGGRMQTFRAEVFGLQPEPTEDTPDVTPPPAPRWYDRLKRTVASAPRKSHLFVL